jgi:hypothetical protein
LCRFKPSWSALWPGSPDSVYFRHPRPHVHATRRHRRGELRRRTKEGRGRGRSKTRSRRSLTYQDVSALNHLRMVPSLNSHVPPIAGSLSIPVHLPLRWLCRMRPSNRTERRQPLWTQRASCNRTAARRSNAGNRVRRRRSVTPGILGSAGRQIPGPW